MIQHPIPGPLKNSLFDRLLAAFPDGLTALTFLSIWILPLGYGDNGVRNGMLIMLVEFILVHASGMLGARLLNPDTSPRDKTLSVLGFGVFYLVFISAWAWTFHAWWPYLAFAWLLVGKFMAAIDTRLPSRERKRRMQSDWAIGAMAYLGGVFATVMLPVPRLGITIEVIHQLHLPGSGLWVNEPQRVIAFGMVYFAVLAWVKYKNYALPENALPKSSTAAEP